MYETGRHKLRRMELCMKREDTLRRMLNRSGIITDFYTADTYAILKLFQLDRSDLAMCITIPPTIISTGSKDVHKREDEMSCVSTHPLTLTKVNVMVLI